MAERVRITGKNDGISNNEGKDAQVDSVYNALHVKSHLFGYDGMGFATPIEVNSNSQLKVTLYGEDGQDLYIENVTGGMPNINTDHALIHYGAGYSFTLYLTLAGAGTKSYCFTAPASLYVHIKNIAMQVLGASVRFELLKGATVTVDTGTAIALNNLNDNSTNTANSTLKEDPTYTGGTAARTLYALADSTNQFTGNATLNANPNEEYVTKAESTKYILKFTNLAASSSVTIAVDAFFYEESKGLSIHGI